MMKRALIILLAGCATTSAPISHVDHERLQAKGDFGAAATANAYATQTALAILERGGTAADAAVAAALVLGVTEPYSAGLGGGGFALIHDSAAGAQLALDFRERAPERATRNMYRDKNGAIKPRASLDGWLSIATPGTAVGLEQLYQLKLKGSGTIPWADLVQPAIDLAANGFKVSPLLHKRIVSRRAALSNDPEASRIFLPAGRALGVGAKLVQTDLAETLGRLAELGSQDWRHGATAQRIAAATDAGGGILTPNDFANYKAHWREPLSTNYRKHRVVSFPPPSSGGVHLVQMLRLLERTKVPRNAYDAQFMHRRIEVMRRAYQDRARHLGDPDFYPVPVKGLIGAKHLDALWGAISERATPSQEVNNPAPEGSGPNGEDQPTESQSTTHLTVVDRMGNAVAMTFTINYGFGAAVIAPGTGVLLNDEMDDFSIAPGAPNAYGLIGGEANAIAPGKTPLSSMTPTLVLDAKGRLKLAIGSPGGSTIITTVLQIILHVLDRDMPLAAAIAQPRLHHQWMPDCVLADRKDQIGDLIRALKAKGHCVKTRSSIGNAHGVLVDKNGRLEAAADPRGEGMAGALNVPESNAKR